jgi:ATP-dependent RNA helicase DDX21
MAAEPSTRTNDDAVPAIAAIEGLRKRVEDVRTLSDEVKTRLKAHGVERLTGIQERCVEAATTRGADVVCRAPTGSGKTLAFVLPIAMMLEKCANEVKEGVLAVIVLPTRELASQVLTHAERYCGAEACALCVGGASAQPQEDAIRSRGARVVIGTPGRIKEFIERKVISLSTVKIQVLDEIDRLLDGGFEGEIDAVMKPPGTCQTLCFSATISASLSRFLDRKLVPGYAEVNASGAGGSNVGGKVEHLSFAIKSDDESVGLAVVNALEHYASKRVDGKVGGQAIIFTEMKSTAERLRATLTNMFTTVRGSPIFLFFSTTTSMTNKLFKGFMRLETVPCS